jgi:hypothetical protein
VEIRRLKNGKISYREKTYINGKPHYGPFFERKTDAQAWKRRMQSRLDEAKILGQNLNPKERITFKEYALRFVETKIKGIRTDGTYRNYVSGLGIHILPIVKDAFLDDIKQEHAETLIQNLVKTGHREAGINKIVCFFKTIMLAAERNDDIIKNPFRNIPR